MFEIGRGYTDAPVLPSEQEALLKAKATAWENGTSSKEELSNIAELYDLETDENENKPKNRLIEMNQISPTSGNPESTPENDWPDSERAS